MSGAVANKLGSIDTSLTLIALVLGIMLGNHCDERHDARLCESEHHHHWTGYVCRRDDGTNVDP